MDAELCLLYTSCSGAKPKVEVLLPKDERESSELDDEVSEAQTVRVFPTFDDWRGGKYRG